MVAPAIGHNRTIPNATRRPASPRSSQPIAVPEGRSRARGARFAAQPGTLSTKAMLTALLSLGIIAAGALFLMHSVASPPPSGAPWPRDPELQAAPASTANPSPTASIPAPTLVAPPSSGTSIASPRAILASPRAVAAAPPPGPGPKRLPQWHSDNPYDEPPTAALTGSPRARPASEGPSDHPYGGRQ
jgi:hypothetical protein